MYAFVGFANIGGSLVGKLVLDKHHDSFKEEIHTPWNQIRQFTAKRRTFIDEPIYLDDEVGNQLFIQAPCDQYEYDGSIDAFMKTFAKTYEDTIRYMHRNKLILIVKVVLGYGSITGKQVEYRGDMTIALEYIKTTRKSFLHPIQLKRVIM